MYHRPWRHAAFVVLALFMGVPAALGEAPIGYVKTSEGEAYIVRADRIAAAVGTPVMAHDTIETGADGALGVTFEDNTVISVGPNSRLSIDEYAFDSSAMEGNFLASLQQGSLTATSGDIARTSPSAMRIITPDATLGVRGTFFAVKVDPR